MREIDAQTEKKSRKYLLMELPPRPRTRNKASVNVNWSVIWYFLNRPEAAENLKDYNMINIFNLVQVKVNLVTSNFVR